MQPSKADANSTAMDMPQQKASEKLIFARRKGGQASSFDYRAYQI
jgi:hypothetical protein